MESPTCFISYTWETAAHSAWVLGLAEQLQSNGVYVRLDQWDTKPGMDLPLYMEESIRESDFVLLVCTPVFAAKANSNSGGVGYEKSVVTSEIFTKRSRDTKFVPVLRHGTDATSLPSYLLSKFYLDFRSDERFQENLETLLRHLHDEPRSVRPPLGGKPSFPRTPQGTAPGGVPEAVAPGPAAAGETQGAATEADVDLEEFDRLRRFAYDASGLNMGNEDAIKWATDRVGATPPFDLQRFIELKDYAYSAEGLNMNPPQAAEWASARLSGDPRFDLQRFMQLKDYAYSAKGLNMSAPRAGEWASARLAENPQFDLERFTKFKDYAYGANGLNMSTAAAGDWALANMGRRRGAAG